MASIGSLAESPGSRRTLVCVLMKMPGFRAAGLKVSKTGVTDTILKKTLARRILVNILY